jgi:hypothetical protein
MPQVDFTSEMVVGAWVGTRATGGYQATITGISVSGGTITVSVREDQPGSNCGVTSAITQPFHLVRTTSTQGSALQNLTVNVYTCP